MTEVNRDCLDADTLAAWADEALDARVRAKVEAHAAGCERCQALLAAMVRTQPPHDATSWWRLPALGWLVPLTVAATALVIWIAVPTRGPTLISDHGAEPAEQSAPPAAAPAPSPVPATDAAPLADAKSTVSSDAAASPRAADDARERRDGAALERQALAAAPLASASAAAPAARAFSSANAVDSIIVSSNPSTRFRLLPGGGVQRSSDGGATWRNEVSGATDTLTAGSSPTPSVCWLIGPSGTVLLSTDDRSWRRLIFPERVDLRTVTATDGESATVTTVDGREFITTDGGRTWSRPPDP